MAYQHEHPTPSKTAVLAVVQYCEARSIAHSKPDIFSFFGIPRRTGYHLLHEESARRSRRQSAARGVLGRRKTIGPDKIREMEQLLETEGLGARAMTWETLGMEVGLEVSPKTIHRAMGTLDYRKCLACRRGWVNNRTANRRAEWARHMLGLYPRAEDWKRVRFSDEVHFGYGPQATLRIIRKPGQRDCAACIQQADSPRPKDEKRIHCWAAVGWNFKSAIQFYEVPGNSNGKMTPQAYIDQVLEPMVKPWLQAGEEFVLEEEGDSGHGPGRSDNMVKTWKREHGLQHYFNCASSPDLAPIENCWLPPKQWVRQWPHWDDKATRELIMEGWSRVSQQYINEQVLSMPERLQAVVQNGGKMTGY